MTLYDTLGITPIINAAGTHTRLGGSLIHPQVTDAMVTASRMFVDMEELHLAAGRHLAELLGVEAAHVSGCCSAGIALMAAACMAGSDPHKIEQLPDAQGMNHRFVVQRPHRNHFDQALRVAGGEFVVCEPTTADLVRIVRETPAVAAVSYTFAWFLPGEVLPMAEVARVAHGAGLPLIVDAAAQIPPLENLTRFVHEGADLVSFSGGKALRGPQSSGLILGRAELIEACRLNDCPNYGIGRAMKTGKEDIVGLVKAVELYLERDHAAELALWERRVALVIESLADLPGVSVRRQFPECLGMQVPHATITWDQVALGLTYAQAVAALRGGSPRIDVTWVIPERYPGFSEEQLRVGPHTLQDGQECVVAARLREILGGRAVQRGATHNSSARRGR